jgi:hypothetical protein
MDSIPLTTHPADDENIVRESCEIDPASSNGPARKSMGDFNNAEEDFEEKQNSPSPAAATLRSSSWILILTLTYAVLAVSSWAILCVLTFRPLTTAHYREYALLRRRFRHPNSLLSDTLIGTYDANPRSLFAHNEKWLQAARVVQTIVSVVTIPVVSAVCSKAAVVFTQSSSKRRNLSLRKTVTLASHGWNEPRVYARLCRGGYRRYGSSLLLLAIFLNILGTFQFDS